MILILKNSQVRRIDAQLDRLQLSSQALVAASPILRSTSDDSQLALGQEQRLSLERITQLQAIVKSLSTASSSRPLLRAARLQELLEQAQFTQATASALGDHAGDAYKGELEWLLIGKATAQTYGLILNTLLEQTIPLSNDIWYWDEVLGSYAYTGLYTIQTSPLRFWDWSKEIYQDARQRFDSLTSGSEGDGLQARSLSDRWRQFYGLVRESIRDRSLTDVRSKVMSPLTIARSEARQKQSHLRRLREMSASGLGVLMDEGLNFDTDDEGSIVSKGHNDEASREEWKGIVTKSVVLMETVLRNVSVLETGVGQFEDAVFISVDEDPEVLQHHAEGATPSRPVLLARKLQQILAVHMPGHITTSKRLAKEYGRPSRWIRYWLPATVLFLSSSTLLRIFVNRKAEIVIWIRDIGTTTIDFWYNWVVQPVKKIIGTIRHDEDSEIAIMSKESLKGDQASLERMVVDFAIDNPNSTDSRPLNELEISEIRAKVKEGDLTPVLKAYERDLRRPIVGTVRGDLIRALLIQIQKTKVDVEVAIGGIDSLLKSQELVFGYVLGLSILIKGHSDVTQFCWLDTVHTCLRRCLSVAERFLGQSQGRDQGQETRSDDPRFKVS